MKASPAPGEIRGSLPTKLLLGLASALVVLLLFEATLALTGSYDPRPPLYPGDRQPPRDNHADSLIGWKFPPSVTVEESTADWSVEYQINRQGFRSRRDFDAPGRGHRIAFLGDSFTFGSGVEYEETFAYLVAKKLGNSREYNLGIGGFGIDQMWMTLRHYALPLEPDLVILSFIRNDLDRSLSAYRLGHVWLAKPTFQLVDGELLPLTAKSRPSAAWRFVRRHSRLLEVWRRAVSSLNQRLAVGYRWRLNRALFAAIRDECRSAGVPLVVVHLPVNRRHAAPMLEKEFLDLGIDFLDLTRHLPPSSDSLYYEHDGHFNAAGHRFAADAIHAFLIERDLPVLQPEPAEGP